MVDNIPQHKHCPICGKAIPLEEEFCSAGCREKYQKMLKRRRQMIAIMYVMLFGVVALLFIIPRL